MAKRKLSEPEKPTKRPLKTPREPELALCVPATAISSANTKSLQQATYVAYQIARAATLFNVSEVVVLSVPPAQAAAEKPGPTVASAPTGGQKITFDEPETTPKIDPKQHLHDDEDSLLLATLLQFFVTPPYLVSAVFKDSKFRKKLKYAEKLPKIPSLPFMANNNVDHHFKEGLSVPKRTPKIVKKNKKVPGKKLSVTKYVNIGRDELLELAGPEIPVNVRVTVDVRNRQVVSPRDAYGIAGNKSTFGYFVRVANNVASIFTESTFAEGYTKSYFLSCDTFFGTADTGIKKEHFSEIKEGKVLLLMSNWNHVEASFRAEPVEGVQKVSELFDAELDMEMGMRVEDAVTVGLARCR